MRDWNDLFIGLDHVGGSTVASAAGSTDAATSDSAGSGRWLGRFRESLSRSRRAMTAQLARHGISLNVDALDDPTRQLVVPPPAVTRVGRAIASLEEIMDDLDHAIRSSRRLSGLP